MVNFQSIILNLLGFRTKIKLPHFIGQVIKVVTAEKHFHFSLDVITFEILKHSTVSNMKYKNQYVLTIIDYESYSFYWYNVKLISLLCESLLHFVHFIFTFKTV